VAERTAALAAVIAADAPDFDPVVREVVTAGLDMRATELFNGIYRLAELRRTADIEPAWTQLGGRPLILEGFVAFDRELSLIGVRSRAGACRFYPLVENEHRTGMLYRSLAPARNTGEELTERACDFAHLAFKNGLVQGQRHAVPLKFFSLYGTLQAANRSITQSVFLGHGLPVRRFRK